MAMLKVALLCILVGCAVANNQDDLATRYKCGSECDEKKMSSDDPNADSMPHTFGAHVPKGPKELRKAMNAYLKDDPVHQEDALMVPRPHAVMPESMVVRDQRPGMPEAEMKQLPANVFTVPDHQQIPYEKPGEGPALRRPCNLDEVLELLRRIKQDYRLEDEHDATVAAAKATGTSPLSAAQTRLTDAQQLVTQLENAKKANETLINTLAAIELKAGVVQDLMHEKAMLVKQEGMLKNPIVKSIGRTNINLQAAITAKQTALNDFAQHPAFTKDEMAQILTTYDELVVSIKKQLAALHKEASDVLAPVQLNINQTANAIQRVQAEIDNLRKEQEELEPLAHKYTPVALDGARAILADAQAHHTALSSARQIDTSAFDQRTSDRAAVLKAVDELLMLVGDIQQPQDPSQEYVETREVKSLAGSVPQRAKAL